MSGKVVDLEDWKQKKKEETASESENKDERNVPARAEDCTRSTVREVYSADLDSTSTMAAQEVIDTTHKYLTITGMDCDAFKSEDEKIEHLKLWYFFSLAVKAIVFWNFGVKDHPFIREIFDRVEICEDGLPRMKKETLYDPN